LLSATSESLFRAELNDAFAPSAFWQLLLYCVGNVIYFDENSKKYPKYRRFCDVLHKGIGAHQERL